MNSPQPCQGSGVGSIPIGRSIKSTTYEAASFSNRFKSEKENVLFRASEATAVRELIL